MSPLHKIHRLTQVGMNFGRGGKRNQNLSFGMLLSPSNTRGGHGSV